MKYEYDEGRKLIENVYVYSPRRYSTVYRVGQIK